MGINISDKWGSIEYAAEYLDVSQDTIRNWIKKGNQIPAHKIGKQWKFKLSELDEWVKNGKSAYVEGEIKWDLLVAKHYYLIKSKKL